VATGIEEPAATARAMMRDTRFMAKPFEGRPGTVT
jgi:hypothetical protein